MKYKYPHYYKKFQCIAQDCEATCCAGWEIVIDEESINKYLEIRSPFGNRLCNSIDFEEGVFHQDGKKRCAFLNDENLCDIYAELGEGTLCYTCTQYPRHIEEFEDVNEVSLSISCPEVASMLLSCREKITFYEEDVEEEVEEFEDFDFLFYEMLYEVREILFRILQNREWSMEFRMQVTHSVVQQVQEKINDYDTFHIDEIIRKYEEMSLRKDVEIGKNQKSEETLSDRYQSIQSHLMELYQLEVLQDEWQPYLMACQDLLYGMPYETYMKLREEFQKLYHEKLERMQEQLMVYFVYSYFCGAVYDGEAMSKYLLSHITTSIIGELWFAEYLKKDGDLEEEEMYRIAYRYAREIEHSDQNLEKLEELYTC